jgi:hypothetical protein
MANQKISNFSPITVLVSGDYFPVVQASGTTNKRVGVDVLDNRYYSVASGVAALSRANEALASGNAGILNAGIAQASGNAALASGNAALVLGSLALASGNLGIANAATALASGNAALVSAASRLSLGGGTLSGGLNVSGAVNASGAITDQIGNVRAIPQTSVGASTYTLASGDIGKHISIASGVVTVPSGVFLVGDAVSIFNNSSGTQIVSGQAGITLRQAGTTNTGQRSIAAFGLTTVLCVNNTQIFVITGAGIS